MQTSALPLFKEEQTVPFSIFSLNTFPEPCRINEVRSAVQDRQKARLAYRRLRVQFPPLRTLDSAAAIGRLDLSKMTKTSEILGIELDSDELVGEVPCPEIMDRSFKLQLYDRICSRIFAYLYLASGTVAASRNTLATYRISLVINCAGLACGNYFDSDISYETYNLLDTPGQDIQPLLLTTRLSIDKAASAGLRVLVHCHQGVSRSATVVIGYVMARLGLSFQAALSLVRSVRGIVSPNTGFICQLIEYEKRIRRGDNVWRSVHDPSAPLVPHSLYRFSPIAVDCVLLPREVPTAVDQLDARSAYLLWASGMRPQRLIGWVGPSVPESLIGPMTLAMRRFAEYLQVYEGAPAYELVGHYDKRFFRGGASCVGHEYLEGEFVEAADFCDCDYCAYMRCPGSIQPRFVPEAEIPPEARISGSLGAGVADWVDFLTLLGSQGPQYPSPCGLPTLAAVDADYALMSGGKPISPRAAEPALPPPADQSPPLSPSASSSEYSSSSYSSPSPSPRVPLVMPRLPGGLALPIIPKAASPGSSSDSETEDDTESPGSCSVLAVYDESQGWSCLHNFEADDLMPDSVAFLFIPSRNLRVMWASGIAGSQPEEFSRFASSLVAAVPSFRSAIPEDTDWSGILSKTADLDPGLDPDDEWPEGGQGALLAVVDDEPDWLCELLDA